jgi:hypothetical protein
VGGDLSQIAVVPGGLDASENGGGLAGRVVPADAEAVAVGGVDAESGVARLVDEGVLRFIEQLLDEDGRARVGEPAAHRLLLSWVELRRANIHEPLDQGLLDVTSRNFARLDSCR